MPPAIVHFESHAQRQRMWREPMRIRTTEARQPEYPEAEITAPASLDRRASRHRKNIPEARHEKISGFPILALATGRPKRGYSSSMQPQADVVGSRFLRHDQRRQLAALRAGTSPAQATFQGLPDHEGKNANRAMDRITMPAALLAFRLRSRLGCQKQVVIGHRGRSE